MYSPIIGIFLGMVYSDFFLPSFSLVLEFFFSADPTVPKHDPMQSNIIPSSPECIEVRSTSSRGSARFSPVYDEETVDLRSDDDLDEVQIIEDTEDQSLSSHGACSQAVACATLPSCEEKDICLVLDNGIYSASYINSSKAPSFATYSRLAQAEAQAVQHLPASTSNAGDQIKKRKSNRQKGDSLAGKGEFYCLLLILLFN